MTLHFPGPYEVELFYTETNITHKMRLNCNLLVEGDAGDPFSSFDVEIRNGAGIDLDVAVLAWVNLIRTLFNASTNFTIANLYKFTPDSFEKTFLSTFNVNLLGSAAGAAVLMQQSTLTFTTNLGGNVRVELLESAQGGNLRIPIRDAAATVRAVADFLVSPTNWVLARDGGYPTGQLNWSNGRNDALENQRFR